MRNGKFIFKEKILGVEKPHIKVKLVLPILFSDESILNTILPILINEFGEIDYQSPTIDFVYTDYYDDEMGDNIKRRFYSFERLINIEYLVQAKNFCNKLELEYTVADSRKVNLDPGYLELGKFVLATTKDQQHRLYIGKNIFEEITLFFRDGRWQFWEWTYPDYRSDEYRAVLFVIREIYKKQLKS